jgi:glycosyltransferase involved in cell wall biosynthesis
VSRVAFFSHVNIPKDGQGTVVHAIRTLELSEALRRQGHQVEVYEPSEDRASSVTHWDPNTLYKQLCQAVTQNDVVVLSLLVAVKVPDTPLPAGRCVIVVDCFDPMLLDVIFALPSNRVGEIESQQVRKRTEKAMRLGDFFLCASAEQRFWLLGLLSAWGRITPATFETDLIAVVPTGVPAEAPRPFPGQFRGRITAEDADIILWPGGVFTWYRPAPLIDALANVLERRPKAHLVFVGASNTAFHPDNPILRDLHERASRLNQAEKRVTFEPAFPYPERDRMYSDADLAVCLFKHSLENELSFRTRLVDIVWGGVPLVTNGGNSLTQLLESYGCSVTLDTLDPRRISDSICELLDDPSRRQQMARQARRCAAERLTWDRVAEPLHTFCQSPQFAADRVAWASRRFNSTTARWSRRIDDLVLRYLRKRAALALRQS